MRPMEFKESVAEDLVHRRIGRSLKMGQIKNSKMLADGLGHNCWICEGWSEVKFTYRPGISDD